MSTQIDHKYLVEHLRHYLTLAREMDDKLPGYFLSMAMEHCEDVVKGREAPMTTPPSKRLKRRHHVRIVLQ
jgi:hypothetical protein